MKARKNVQVYICSQSDMKLLMLKRTPQKSGYWQPVCGGIEHGESIVEAGIRELHEETGIKIIEKIEVVSYEFKYREKKNGEYMDMKDYCMLVFVSDCPEIQLSKEHETYKWCGYEEVCALTDWRPIIEVAKALRNRKYIQ